jgi:hypothetical protein
MKPSIIRGVYSRDGGRYIKDDGEPAVRSHVASFKGGAYSAERGEDGDLHIYMHSRNMIPNGVMGDDISASRQQETEGEKANRLAEERLQGAGLKNANEEKTVSTGDRGHGPMTPAKLQAINVAWREREYGARK